MAVFGTAGESESHQPVRGASREKADWCNYLLLRRAAVVITLLCGTILWLNRLRVTCSSVTNEDYHTQTHRHAHTVHRSAVGMGSIQTHFLLINPQSVSQEATQNPEF